MTRQISPVTDENSLLSLAAEMGLIGLSDRMRPHHRDPDYPNHAHPSRKPSFRGPLQKPTLLEKSYSLLT